MIDSMKIGNKVFDFKHHTYVMGILNVTPDSFSDGGKWNQLDAAKKCAEQMIKDGVGSNVNIQHVEGSNVEGVNLQELFVIDREKGIDPVFFKDVPDGSLIGFYKVHNQEVWNKIENGDVLSFSLEGIFNLVPEEFKNEEDEEYNEIVELINKLKNKLK